jgi:oligosaccharide repeat unit polymerase
MSDEPARAAAHEASVSDWSSPARRLLQPFQVLLAVYFVYFAVVYSRVWAYMPQELLNLRTFIMGFQPGARTVALYLYGAVVLVFAFLLGVWAVGSRRGSAPLAGLVERISEGRAYLERRETWFYVGIAGWVVGAAAVLAQWVGSRGISLTDIGTRWFQSPLVVAVAMSQIFFVPMLVVTATRPWQRWLTAGLFLVSVAGLATLGARNIPAKAIVSTFLAVVYVAKPRQLVRVGVAMLLVLVLAMGFVGAFSKAGIYGTSASAKLVAALTYSDSVGTVYNLDRIVRITPTTGQFGGTLLRDSALAGVPRVLYSGTKPEYANFQIGRYLGGRQYFIINGERIDRGVSLAPTLLGAAYADGGVGGVVIQLLILGFLLGYLQLRGRTELWIVPFLVTFASYVINGVNVGVHSPHSLAAIAIAVLVVVADLLAGRRPTEPSVTRSVAA